MKRLSLFFFITFIFISFSHANLITSEKFNYTMDLPEGFEITDMETDETTVIFKNKYLEVYVLVKVWPDSKFSSSMESLKDTMTRLKAATEYSQCTWRRQVCTLSTFTSPSLLETNAKGWACGIPLPQKRGYLTILAYSPEEFAGDLEQLLVSILDSVMIDAGSFREPGLITTAFFPRNSPEQLELTIQGKKISTQTDKTDSEASQFIIDREFSIFKFYAENQLPETFDAWIRFYRLIGRDTMERVRKTAFDIFMELKETAEEKDSENPEAALAQILLNWAQNFNYERKSSVPDKADIESIPAILKGGASDCDGRSLLLMCILKNCGIDSCMFVSAEYSHALLGVYLPGKLGQTIPVKDENGTEKEYLVGETTAKDITLGMIPQDMQDRNKWITVELP